MKRFGAYTLLAILCFVLFLGALGRTPLMFFDEEIYSECAREMLADRDYVVPRVDGEHFFDKPPLSYWMQAGAMRTFGVNSLGARLPSALAGMLLVCWTVFLGNRLFGKGAGVYSGFALATSILLVGASRMGIMDSLFSLTIGLALGLFLLTYLKMVRWWGYVGFWAAMGIASLIKGPAGVVLILLAVGVFLLLRRDRSGIRRATPTLGPLVFLAISLPWYLMVHKATGGEFTQEFLLHQNLARAMGKDFHHNAPLLSYIPLFAVGFFPWSIFTVRAWISHVRLRPGDDTIGQAALFSAVWLVTIIGVFTLSKSKLPGYIIPALPGSALLVGLMWSRVVASGKAGLLKGYAWAAFAFAALVSVALQVGQRYLEEPITGLSSVLLLMSLCLFAGPVAALVMIHKDRANGAFVSLCAGMAGFIGVAAWLGLPLAAATMGSPMVAIARQVSVEAGPQDMICAYTLNPSKPALAFYAGRLVPDVDAGELISVLKSGRTVFVIVQEDSAEDLPTGGRPIAKRKPYLLLRY